jgi:effector-binding domain-containing protein
MDFWDTSQGYGWGNNRYMAFIRRVKTASGATAIQIATKQKGQIVKIIHIGSAHTGEELAILLALARSNYKGTS